VICRGLGPGGTASRTFTAQLAGVIALAAAAGTVSFAVTLEHP